MFKKEGFQLINDMSHLSIVRRPSLFAHFSTYIDLLCMLVYLIVLKNVTEARLKALGARKNESALLPKRQGAKGAAHGAKSAKNAF